MRMLLDACVLFPTVMREMLIGTAEAGLFEPLWSERIIAEWLRASARLGETANTIAAAEAALMVDRHRQATVIVKCDKSGSLPDPGDDHVLAAAISGAADGIVTRNTRDFPLRVLGAHGLSRSDPDTFLRVMWQENSDALNAVAEQVRQKAEKISGRPQEGRTLLKRAGMPRLGKAIYPKT